MSDVKKIILSNGETKELTFEQVVSKYKGMVFNTLNRANYKFRSHHLYDSEKDGINPMGKTLACLFNL